MSSVVLNRLLQEHFKVYEEEDNRDALFKLCTEQMRKSPSNQLQARIDRHFSRKVELGCVWGALTTTTALSAIVAVTGPVAFSFFLGALPFVGLAGGGAIGILQGKKEAEKIKAEFINNSEEFLI